MDPDAPILLIRAIRKSGDFEPFPLRLLSFRVEDDERKVAKATFQVDNGSLQCFSPPLSKWLVPGTILGCRWGYPGNLSREWHFELKHVKGFRKLTLELFGKKILAHGDTRTRTWEGLRRSEVAEGIALDLGYPPAMQYVQETDEVFPHIIQSQMTDAQFLTWLARREGFEFWIDPDGLHWKQRPADQEPADVYVYHLGGGNARVLSFTPDTDVAIVPARVRVRTYDPNTRETIEEVADNENTTDLPTTGGYSPVGYEGDVDGDEFATENELALQGMPAAMVDVLHQSYGVTLNQPAPPRSTIAPETIEVVDMESGFTEDVLKTSVQLTEEVDRATHERVIALPMGTRADARRVARAAYQRARQAVVKGTLVIIGDPQREARQVVGFKVPGAPMFEGKYYVTSCVHDRKAGGGYKTILKLDSDGLKKAAGPAKVKTKGKEASTPDEAMGPATPEGAKYNLLDESTQSDPAVEVVEMVDLESGETVLEFQGKK